MQIATKNRDTGHGGVGDNELTMTPPNPPEQLKHNIVRGGYWVWKGLFTEMEIVPYASRAQDL